MIINNKPENTIFTKLFEDKTESLRVEVCGVTNKIRIFQFTEAIEVDGADTEWLISILKDSLRLIEHE